MAKEPETVAVDFKGVSKKVHFDVDGNPGRSATPGETKFQMLFATGDILEIKPKDLSPEMWIAAGWHGLAQKLGDSYSNQKESGDDPYESASAMLEQIVNGNWVAEKKATGPRIGLLVEAIVAALTKAGKTPDEKAIAEKCKDKAYVAGAKANAAVDAEYQRIAAERAADRAKKATEKAKGADAKALDEL